MKISRLFSAVLSAAAALLMITPAASAQSPLEITPSDTRGLKQSSDGAAVKFSAATELSGKIGRQADGLWVLGGDLGDTGITIDTMKKYKYFEIDYAYEQGDGSTEIIEGLMTGPIFKVHIAGRTADNGSDVYNDYLGEAWVPYGPDGTAGKGKTFNSLETIYRTQVKEQGTISIPMGELTGLFDSSSDYLLGIGIGADSKNYVSSKDNGKEFKIKVNAVRLTDDRSYSAGPNVLKGETESAPADETPAPANDTPSPAETTEQAPADAQQDNAPAQTTASAKNGSSSVTVQTQPKAQAQAQTEQEDSNSLIIVLVIAIVVIIGAVVGAVIVLNKKKR